MSKRYNTPNNRGYNTPNNSRTKMGNIQKENEGKEYTGYKEEENWLKSTKMIMHNKELGKYMKLGNNINYGEIWDSTKGYPGEGPAQINGKMGKNILRASAEGTKNGNHV